MNRTNGGCPMTLAQIAEAVDLKVLCGSGKLDREVSGGYVCDLLSDVMAHSLPGQVWITLQGHINTVAVAQLRELAGMILTTGRRPDADTLAKAEEVGLPILVSRLPAFELAGRLHRLLGG